MYRLKIEKESFKFSATHFALFGPGCAERLHGHNYYVKFYVTTDSVSTDLGMGIEFNELKSIFQSVCNTLDEFILIPKNSPYLRISQKDLQTEVVFNDKTYSFPSADAHLVPLVNITVEELSKYVWEECLKDMAKYQQILAFGVEVQETKGQSCLFEKPPVSM